MGDRQRPGGNQPNTRRENAQLRPGSVRKSLSCCPRESLRLMHEPDPYRRGSFGAAGSRRAARTSKRGRAGRAAAGGSAPGPHSPLPPGRSCSAWVGGGGHGGAPRRVPGRLAGGLSGEERPEPRPRRAELRARRRRRRQDKGDHVRREGGGRGRRRRRAHRGGGGGFSPAAASGSPTARPASPAAPRAAWSWSRRRRRRDRGGRSGSLYLGPISPARGAGGAAAVGAPGRLHGADGASWPELAGGRPGRPRDWLGSGPRSARGRLPLPPAHSSSELHRRPAPRTPWLDGWREGAAAEPGPLAPDFAPRLRPARLLQTLAALGAGLPRPAEPEPRVPPPLLRPAPRAPPLVAPPLGPIAGSAPRGRRPRARHRQLSLPPRLRASVPRLPSWRTGAAETATVRALPVAVASSIEQRQGKATRPAARG